LKMEICRLENEQRKEDPSATLEQHSDYQHQISTLKRRNVELETQLEESQELLQSLRGEYNSFKHNQDTEQTFLKGQVEQLQHELKKQTEIFASSDLSPSIFDELAMSPQMRSPNRKNSLLLSIESLQKQVDSLSLQNQALAKQIEQHPNWQGSGDAKQEEELKSVKTGDSEEWPQGPLEIPPLANQHTTPLMQFQRELKVLTDKVDSTWRTVVSLEKDNEKVRAVQHQGNRGSSFCIWLSVLIGILMMVVHWMQLSLQASDFILRPT